MAAAAVVTDLAGAELVPGLGHVQHQAIFIERLESPGDVSRNFRQEARVGIAVRIGGLFDAIELPYGDLSQDPHALLGVVVERAAALRMNLTRWFQRQDAN